MTVQQVSNAPNWLDNPPRTGPVSPTRLSARTPGARQAEKGYTQPQFQLLRNLPVNGISPTVTHRGRGITTVKVRKRLSGNAGRMVT
ncbi:hypothetical protein [Streptomyces pseudovenezuelae]|uniref:Uncharacterized protein n=1 Tax=Streptomyces pseudovenezuelae TaxID=67350 RepID=A0ABZ1X9V2_9ACTN|nr:hypothetical protein [Streptomyces pseudovenezuelae]